MLRAARIRMRNPYRGKAEDVGEDVVGQRAAEVGQHDGLCGRARDARFHALHPGMLRVEARGREIALARWRHAHLRESLAREVTPKRGHDVLRIDADDVAQLAMRRGSAWDGVDRMV